MECTQDNALAREPKASRPQLEQAVGTRPHPTITIARAPSVVARAPGAPIPGLTLRKRPRRDDDQARFPLRHPRHLRVSADADTFEHTSDARVVSKRRATGCKAGARPGRQQINGNDATHIDIGTKQLPTTNDTRSYESQLP